MLLLLLPALETAAVAVCADLAVVLGFVSLLDIIGVGAAAPAAVSVASHMSVPAVRLAAVFAFAA